MVITKQVPTIHIQKIKRKEPKHSSTENYQIINEESKGGRKEKRNDTTTYQKTMNKVTVVSP